MTDGASGSPAPELRCFPADDAEFLADAQAALGVGLGPKFKSERQVELVSARLRTRYPLVRIVPRHPFAVFSGEPLDLWYCYRDGALINPRENT
jgi:hypothetical protein